MHLIRFAKPKVSLSTNNFNSINIHNLLLSIKSIPTMRSSVCRLLSSACNAEIKEDRDAYGLGVGPRPSHYKFNLDPQFVEDFRQVKPKFGFNGLGEFVYRRTYSRVKADGNNEEWFETVARVVNGTYSMQKHWMHLQSLPWDEASAQITAQEMFRRIFDMKFLPPGRGLWAMGTPITDEKGLYAALNNCAFVSTCNIEDNPSQPFAFLMDAAMLGVGVGFDTEGAGKVTVRGPSIESSTYNIPDSREGWVESVKILLDSYFQGTCSVEFDYSSVRPAGLPIRGFGGISSGPEPLRKLHSEIRRTLNPLIGEHLTITSIVDLMNHIGCCVVSGNVRRTAEIAFGAADKDEYLDLKNYDINPQRQAHGWTSNNSIFAQLGMDYTSVCQRIIRNGEPGLAWLDNMRNFGRMNGVIDQRDHKAAGGNPCLEQTLESYELCCLVETFPSRHKDLQDFLETLDMALTYAKTVTLGLTHWDQTNGVMSRNRRIGCSMSGLAQFITQRGVHELQSWCKHGYEAIQKYDEQLSRQFSVARSIKTTCIKPSGTVSLLAGATPGMHYPESRFYIRRVRLAKTSHLLTALIQAGFHVEDSVNDPHSVVVEFPVDAGKGIRTSKELTIWEQLSLAAFLQRHWADNQVSCTCTFDSNTESSQISHALDYFQYHLKGVSFLPRIESGEIYPQMPYEEVSEEVYLERVGKLSTLSWSDASSDPALPDKFCDSSTCELDFKDAIPSEESEDSTNSDLKF